jgi:hypothetical protein
VWQPLAHRPGAIPLRPLKLGDILEASFRIIRRNAAATVGAAVLVSAITMLIPLVYTALLTFDGSLDFFTSTDSEFTDVEAWRFVGWLGVLVLGLLLQSIGLAFVSAMATPVTLSAALGKRMTMAQAWAATHGKRWRLVGLIAFFTLASLLALTVYIVPFVLIAFVGGGTPMYVLWGLLGFAALIVGMAWGWTRLYLLSIPALMAEGAGVFQSLRRGYSLSAGQFWRLLGIALLVSLIALFASFVLAMPVSLLAQLAPALVGDEYALLGLTLSQLLSTLIQSAFTTPFVAVSTSLLYIDQRIRKEAFDIELMERAGLVA